MSNDLAKVLYKGGLSGGSPPDDTPSWNEPPTKSFYRGDTRRVSLRRQDYPAWGCRWRRQPHRARRTRPAWASRLPGKARSIRTIRSVFINAIPKFHTERPKACGGFCSLLVRAMTHVKWNEGLNFKTMFAWMYCLFLMDCTMDSIWPNTKGIIHNMFT